MSSLSYRGVLFQTAAKTLPKQPENEEHAHNAIHAPVQHTHINVDVPDDLRVMNLQVSAVEGDYDDTLPGGLVADVIYVSEALNVVDQAFIRVDPDTDIIDTSVLIGYDPNTMKDWFFYRQLLPQQVLGNWHPTGTVRRAIGDRHADVVQVGLDVVGGPLAMVHCHDDRRTAKSTIPRSKDFRVCRSHRRKFGPHSVTVHQVMCFKFSALTLLTNSGYDHTAGDIVVAAFHDHRCGSAVLIQHTSLSPHARQPKTVLSYLYSGLECVVHELDFFLKCMVQLNLACRYLIGTTPVDHLDCFASRQPLSNTTGIHSDITAAHYHHGFG